MNLFLDISPKGSPVTALPADRCRTIAPWTHFRASCGRYQIRFVMQESDRLDSGFGMWTGGALAWLGSFRRLHALRVRLGLAGTAPLASVLARGLQRFGTGIARHLDGEFALVVVNRDDASVAWVRDRFGRIPAMYQLTNRQHAWVGTCLCAFEGQHPRPSRSRLAQFLTWTLDQSNQDFFDGVQRLKPASTLHLGLSDHLSSSTEQYWFLRAGLPADTRTFRRRFRDLVTDRVETALVHAPAPAVSLSSGLDSLYLASIAAERAAIHGAPPFSAGTMVFPSHPDTDETEQVELLSSELQVPTQLVNLEDCPPRPPAAEYGDLWGYGPCFHPGESYETEFIRRLQRHRSFDLLLTGIGAELLFPGSAPAITSLAIERLRAFARLRSVCSPEALAVAQQPPVHELVTGLIRRRVPQWVKTPVRLVRSTLRPGPYARQLGRARTLFLAQTSIGQDPDSSLAQTNVLGWGWELVTRMAWRKYLRTGVWLDFPFADRRLWTLSQRVPAPWLANESRSNRYIMRRLVAGVIPERFRRFPKHGLFEDFVRRSFRQYLLEWNELFQTSILDNLQLVDDGSVSEFLIRQLMVTGTPSHPAKQVGSMILWTPMTAELWLQAWFR